MRQFSRIERLPPYVLGIVNELKYDARRRGEDIIDFGFNFLYILGKFFC